MEETATALYAYFSGKVVKLYGDTAICRSESDIALLRMPFLYIIMQAIVNIFAKYVIINVHMF